MARPYRSLFWPILILGIGVVWLLANLGYIAPISWSLLLRLWPVLLIVAGIDLLIGRSSQVIGALIGLLTVAFIVYVLVAGGSLAVGAFANGSATLVTDHFVEPIGNANSANVYLDLGSVSSSVYALNTSSSELFDATIDHYGQVRFTATGDTAKTLRLTRDAVNSSFFDTFGPQPRQWQIGMSAKVPTELAVNSGSGSVHLDLTPFQLRSLNLDSGSGSVNLTLANAQQPYRANVNGGSGSLDISAPCAAGIELHLDGGSGSQNIEVANNCPLRVEVNDSGSGSINLPHNLTRTQGQGNQDLGVWETSGYSASAPHVLIVVDGHGSGSLNVR